MTEHVIRGSVLIVLSFFVSAAESAQGSVGDSRIATWKDNAKAAYSLSTDDCQPSQVYTVAPALTERGLHGTFYVNPSANKYGWYHFKNIGDVNGDGLADGYVHLPEQGHELASHTLEHWAVTVGSPPPGYPNSVFPSYEALARDCVYVNQYLEGLTGQRVVSFAYPWGKNDAPGRAVVDDYYLSARATLHMGPTAGHYVPNPATPADMMTLWCYYAEGNQPWCDYRVYEQAAASFQLMLNDTVAAGGWGIEFFHGTGDDWVHFPYPIVAINPNAYYEHLDNIVNRANVGDIWQDTVGNVSRYIYSRDGASIEFDEISDTTIELRVDDMLDDDLFCVPLTVNTLIPESWADRLLITHSGEPVQHTVYVDPLSGFTYASYDVIADGQAIVLTPAPEALLTVGPGDYDADGDVDQADYDRWRSDFGMTVATPGLGADGNGDGIVDAADYTVWRDNLVSASALAVAAVPEPSTLIDFLLMGLVACLVGPRTRAFDRRRPS